MAPRKSGERMATAPTVDLGKFDWGAFNLVWNESSDRAADFMRTKFEEMLARDGVWPADWVRAVLGHERESYHEIVLRGLVEWVRDYPHDESAITLLKELLVTGNETQRLAAVSALDTSGRLDFLPVLEAAAEQEPIGYVKNSMVRSVQAWEREIKEGWLGSNLPTFDIVKMVKLRVQIEGHLAVIRTAVNGRRCSNKDFTEAESACILLPRLLMQVRKLLDG